MTIAAADTTAAKIAPANAGAVSAGIDRVGVPGWLQAMPFGLVFLFFFVVPLVLVVIVSFWDYNDYAMLRRSRRAATPRRSRAAHAIAGSLHDPEDLWLDREILLHRVAVDAPHRLHHRLFPRLSRPHGNHADGLFLVCTIPFWTSNVIRMISWIPLLGRNGLVNLGLERAHVVDKPVEWLLYSPFSVGLAFTHLFTFFMVVPILTR